MEDSHWCFTTEDRQNFVQVREASQRRRVQHDEYTKAWQKKLKVLRPPPAIPKAKAKAVGRDGRRRGRGHHRSFCHGEIWSKQISGGSAPQGGTFWRGNRVGSWDGHLEPFPRCSASWHLYGHRESPVMCLRDMWRKYLATQALDESSCPVVGLFQNDGQASLPAQGSA